MNPVGSYIATFPKDVQEILSKIRTIIKNTAPDCEESMVYGMPAYKTHNSPLVYFAGYKNHIGFYATPSGHSEFKTVLSKYKQGKGSVQFRLDKPIPFELIEPIVTFKLEENKQKFLK